MIALSSYSIRKSADPHRNGTLYRIATESHFFIPVLHFSIANSSTIIYIILPIHPLSFNSVQFRYTVEERTT